MTLILNMQSVYIHCIRSTWKLINDDREVKEYMDVYASLAWSLPDSCS